MGQQLSRKRVTLADVAARAGVSRSAASVALSRRASTTMLRPETRERILKTARRLNYQPDIRARGLAFNRSYLVALLARKTFDRWVVGISRGIEGEVRNRSYSLLSYTYGESTHDEEGHLQLSLERNVDGLVVMPSLDADGRTNAEAFAALQADGLPIVQLFNRILPGIPAVLRGHAAGTRLAMEHLLALGHRRIVHVTHERSDADHDPHDAYLDARFIKDAYGGIMRKAGLEPVVVTHPVPATGGVDFAQGADAVAASILALPERPTAIITYSDYQALGLIRALHAHSVRVPDDLSIIGSDDEDASRVMLPSLTSIRYPREEIGRQAARILMTQMDGSDGELNDVVIEPELRQRESCSAPASFS